MTIETRLLQKVLVKYFYQVNAGFFTFGFFVLFGLPYSVLAFHLSIITGIISNYHFLCSVLFVWFLYNLKCTNYIIKQIRDERQAFLFCLNCLSRSKLCLYMLYVQVLVYMPVLAYAMAIAIIAFNKHQVVSAIIVIFYNVIITWLTASTYVYALRRQPFINIQPTLPVLNLNIRKPFFLVPLYFICLHRKQMLLITKVFSLFVLSLFINLYKPEEYDVRPLQLCLLIIAAAHTAIVFQIRSFEEERLSFLRTLPVTIINSFINNIAMFIVLLLPELLFILKGIKVHFLLHDYPGLTLMPVSLLCMFYVVLLIAKTDMNQLTRIVFGIMAACFFIILYSPGILLPVAIILIAFMLFNSYCYYW